MKKHTKIGCEIFIIKDDKILLGKRKNCYGEGTWGLPGGHLEYNEKLIDAAKRELKEELNIENADLEMVTIVDDVKDDGHYLHISFVLKDFDGKFELMEPERCESWEYFELNNLAENIFPPHQRIFKTFLEKKLYLY